MKKEVECVDVIETNIIFAVDISVNVKVRKTTSYGSSQPQYTLAEIAGVAVPVDGLDCSIENDIINNICKEIFSKVKEYEKNFKEGEKEK